MDGLEDHYLGRRSQPALSPELAEAAERALIYMTDANHGVVRKITPSGTISIWAGVAGAT